MTGRRYLKLLILVTLGVLLLGAIGLTACGYQTTTTTSAIPATPATPATPASGGGNTSPQPVTVQVTLSGFAFSPATVTVPVGSTVIWTNKDSTTHTVTSDGGVFASGNLAVGDTFSHTFNQAGTFQYHCQIHPSMTGKIIVQ